MKTYQGSCHCKKITFEVKADIDSLRVCNCSICHKRGALIFRVSEDSLKIHNPLSDLSLYEWHTKTAKDYFCPECGILPFRRPSALTASEIEAGMMEFNGWAVNARCLDGLNTSDIPIKTINGKDLE